MLGQTPAKCQRGFRIALQPGYAYAFDFGSGSAGGSLGFLVRRTRTVAVGVEAGYFGVGTQTWSTAYRDPESGPVTLYEQHRQSFWFLAATAQFRLPSLRSANPYVNLGTGFYRFHDTRATDEVTATGDAVRVGWGDLTSYSSHPGISVGLGLDWWPTSSSWSMTGELRVHSILGADGGFYPVAIASIGIAKCL
jgi:hypothetical protein